MLLLGFILSSALWAENIHGLSYTHNRNTVDHLNSMNTTKPWFKLLQYSIHQTIRAVQQQMDIYFVMLFSEINKLKRWCIPSDYESVLRIQYHVKLLIPCGFVQIESEFNKLNDSWTVHVPAGLSVQLYFLVFKMDVSHRGCEHSAFLVAYHDYTIQDWIFPDLWVFCGHRKPWYETAPSRTVSMFIRQINVRQRCNITIIYTSLEESVAEVYINHTDIYVLPLMKPNDRLHVLGSRLLPMVVQNWRIVADYGFRLHVSSLHLCCSSNRVAIYDGFQEDFALRYKKEWNGEKFDKKFDFHSNFFQMELHFHLYHLNYSIRGEMLIVTIFERVLLPIKKAEMNSVTKVSNNGNILYAAYSLGTTARDRVYPNVSLVIRKFDGWNEGSCKFGGYFITEALHHSTDKIGYSLGPFCSKSIPTEPFVGTHGHKNLVFGRQEIYIILYAFGSLYTLDLDLVVLPSLCEGIFELPSNCLDNSRTRQEIAREYDYYSVKCDRTQRWNTNLFISFVLSAITNCVVLQGVGYSPVEEERYEILASANVNINVKRAPAFQHIGKHYGRSEARLTAIGIDENFFATTFNKSLDITLNNTAVIHLRIINVQVHQIIAYTFYMNAVMHDDKNCSNSSGVIEHAGDIDGKIYHKILLVNHCGFILFKVPGVLILRFFFKSLNTEENSTHHAVSHIKHVEISRLQCTKNGKYRHQDKLTIATDSGGVSHSIRFVSENVKLELFQRFGLIVEKSTACASFRIEYRVQRFRTISEIRYVLVGDLQEETHVMHVSIMIILSKIGSSIATYFS